MGRGPSYPYVALEAGVGFAQRMYDYAKKGSAPLESVMTVAWKFSATSSSAVKTYAALKAFGLIEDAPSGPGKPIRLTDRSKRILLDDQDSPERREEIKKAALSPKWYEYCWKTWGKEMPPAMKSNLLIEHGFVDSTVETFLRDYRKTMAFAGLLDDPDFSQEDEKDTRGAMNFKRGDYVRWESQGVLRMPEAKQFSHYSDDGEFGFVLGSFTGIPRDELILATAPDRSPLASQQKQPAMNHPVAQGGLNMQTDTLSLADGITLQFQWPAVISEDAYEDFLYQLEGFKRRVGRAVQKKQDTQNSSGAE